MAIAPCPKCGRRLQPCGVMTVNGIDMPTYQCDECIVPIDIGGEHFDGALTFCLGPDGKPFTTNSPGDGLAT